MSKTKEKETTLDNVKNITNKRRDGNTTRLVDNAIQILFSGKICICLDHHNNENAHKNLFDRVIYRLTRELYVKPSQIKVENLEVGYEIELL